MRFVKVYGEGYKFYSGTKTSNSLKVTKEIGRRLFDWIKMHRVYQNKIKDMSRGGARGVYLYRCSICGAGAANLRINNDSGVICLMCYLKHEKCKCGNIAIIAGKCRECYMVSNELF